MPGSFERHFDRAAQHNTSTPGMLLLVEQHGAAAPHAYRADRDQLDVLLHNLTGAVQINLDLGGRTYPLQLGFADLESFEPHTILKQIDIATTLHELARALTDPAAGGDAAARIVTLLDIENSPEAPAPAEAPAQNEPGPTTSPQGPTDDFTRLLGDDAPRRNNPQMQRVGDFIRSVIAEDSSGLRSNHYEALGELAQLAIHDLLRQVLSNPAFRARERICRGINWLMTTVDLEETVNLWIQPVNFAAQREAPATVGETLRQISTALAAGATGNKLSTLAIDYDFQTPADITLLNAYAEFAAQTDTLILAGAPSAVVPFPHPAPPDEPPDRDDCAAAWASFRDSTAAQCCAVAWPRVLLRAHYGVKSEACYVAGFEELLAAPDHENFLWGNPVYALLQLACGQLESPGSPWLIEDMPLAIYDDGSGDAIKPPTEIYLSEQQVAALQANGIMALQSYRNRNAVLLESFHTAN